MSKPNYLNFDLLIDKSGNLYKAQVLHSPAGEGTSHFVMPFSHDEIRDFAAKLEQHAAHPDPASAAEADFLQEFGGLLFRAVFDGDVAGCFRSSHDEAIRQSTGLRLRLRLAHVAELADLPWEYLFNPAVGRFLSLSVETPIIRYLDLPERVRPLTLKLPLNILVMVSNPADQPQLDIEGELAELHEGLRGLIDKGLVTIQHLEEATLQNLRQRLRQEEYHVFHFIGHGTFDQQRRTGMLIFENDAEMSHLVSSQHLGTILHDENTLRLAVLNACDAAHASSHDAFAGIAQNLVQQGIPAVIAMQQKVTDNASVLLTQEFYAAIADGYPVDAALAEARKAIFASGNQVEWGIPVLYMRSPDGRIFDIESAPEVKTHPEKEAKAAGEPDRAARAPSSIAVLPFVDMSPGKDQEYFCDGMAEELIAALAKIEGLHVVSRTSAFQFKGQAYDVRKIGEQLNVGSVHEGSVRKAGNKLRITAQLTNVKDGYQIWSEKYDRELDDVFAIQEDIARTVVDTLKIKLLDKAEAPLIRRHTDNLEAYHLYLKGRYFWNKRETESLKQAMICFQQAIEKDPAYAVASTGLAECYLVLGLYEYLPPEQTFPQARALAETALRVDDTLEEAHATLGSVRWLHDWDWNGAEKELQRALEINPDYAVGHIRYADFLSTTGHLEEGLAYIQRAQKLDPLSIVINATLGILLFFARQYDQAEKQLRETLQLDPTSGLSSVVLGWVYEQQLRYDEARAAFQTAENILGLVNIRPLLARLEALSGNPEKSEMMLAELNKLSPQQYLSSYQMAAVYLGLGDTSQAIQWLEKAYAERGSWLVFLNVDPRFDKLHANPQFTELMNKIGFPKQFKPNFS